MTPRWGEAPERVTAMIASILKSGAVQIDPSVWAEKQKSEFEAEARKIRDRIARSLVAKLKFKSGFEKQLKRARAFFVERERMREASRLSPTPLSGSTFLRPTAGEETRNLSRKSSKRIETSSCFIWKKSER